MGLLEGKVVLVTGAGRGLGRGYALTLAELGARVVVNDVGVSVRGEGRDTTVAGELVALLRDRGSDAVADYSDVSQWSGSEQAVRTGIEHFGRLDGVVNNAGIFRPDDIADVTESDFDAQIGVHLKGSFGCTKHACAYWRDENRAGRRPNAAVVNITSEGMIQGLPRTGVYSTAKAGIFTLTQIASLEAGHYGVRINAVAPLGMTRMTATSGLVDVDSAQPVPNPEDMDDAAPTHPFNTAPLVAWLLSDEAGCVTGQVFKMAGASWARVNPISWGPLQRPPAGQLRWRADQLGEAMGTDVFGSRFPMPMRVLADGTKEPFYELKHD